MYKVKYIRPYRRIQKDRQTKIRTMQTLCIKKHLKQMNNLKRNLNLKSVEG